MADKWSERAEELVDEGNRQGAIKFLEDVVEKMQTQPGAHSNLSLAAAMGDLAALYQHEGHSLKADSLRNSALVMKLKAQGSTGSQEDEDEQDWERADLAIPTSSPPVEDFTSMSLEEKTTKQRGRGAFTYGSGGLYSDSTSKFQQDDGDGDEETLACNNAVREASHVLVIHGFSSKTTTRDLELLLKSYATSAVIRWVNDTTALAVFQNPATAREALAAIRNPLYKIKAYDEAVDMHELVSDKDLEPPVPRPSTSARAAQRMIVGALANIGSKVPKPRHKFTAAELQKQEEERKQRLLAREKLRQEAWGSD